MTETTALSRVEARSQLEELKAFELSPQEVERQAGLLKTQWGSSVDLERQDFQAIVTMSAAMGMNAIFDLDILGGKPYDKADFWKGLLAGHPDVAAIEGPHRIEYGTPEWDDLICVSDPDVIAAAYMLTVHMHSRSLPVREGQYVKREDPILWAPDRSREKSFGKGSKEPAQEYAGRHGKVRWVTDEKAKPWNPAGWHASPGRIDPAWEGLAAKKCRTTVFRRVGKIAIPRTHAKVLSLLDRIQRMVDTREAMSAGAVAPVPEEPYADDPKPEPIHVTAQEVETSEVKVGDEGSSKLKERDRRSLMANATRKGLKIDGVKSIFRQVRGLRENAEVHISSMTYDELEKVIAVIDEIDEPRHEVPSDPEKTPATSADNPPIDLWPDQ